MSDDDIVIIEPAITPKPKPKPLIKPEPGRTYGDLSPAQKARMNRRQQGPFFFEPIYSAFGLTCRWRVGREEITINEFASKEETMDCFRKLVGEFFGRA